MKAHFNYLLFSLRTMIYEIIESGILDLHYFNTNPTNTVNFPPQVFPYSVLPTPYLPPPSSNFPDNVAGILVSSVGLCLKITSGNVSWTVASAENDLG